jgi:hypothetical protein
MSKEQPNTINSIVGAPAKDLNQTSNPAEEQKMNNSSTITSKIQ